MSGEPLDPGEQFLAKLKLGTLVLLIYTVRRCTPAQDGYFKIGGELTGTVGPPDDCEADSIRKAILGETG